MSLEPVDYDKSFAALVDEVVLRQREFNAPIVVGQTPEVLLTVGQKSLPIAMPASVVQKAREKHGVSVDDIKTLPRQLRNPVMIFESETHPKSLNILVDFRNREGKPVTVAIHFDVPIASHIGHKVATISERNESQIELWKAKGLVRYVDQEKQKAWFQFTGLQLPGDGPTRKDTLAERTEIVNRSSRENSGVTQEKQKAHILYDGRQSPGGGSKPIPSIPQPGPGDGKQALVQARLETESRLSAREDLAPEAKAGVLAFLNRQEAEKIWKSQTLNADGRIAAARLINGEATFEQAIKGLPEIQHGVVRALARDHSRGQARGRGEGLSL